MKFHPQCITLSLWNMLSMHTTRYTFTSLHITHCFHYLTLSTSTHTLDEELIVNYYKLVPQQHSYFENLNVVHKVGITFHLKSTIDH